MSQQLRITLGICAACLFFSGCGADQPPSASSTAGAPEHPATSTQSLTDEEGYCGDGSCNNGEDCSSCDGDCGSCGYCGDGSCNNGEDCTSCDSDCGSCGYCGDGSCDNGEDCGSCEADCGPCDPIDPYVDWNDGPAMDPQTDEAWDRMAAAEEEGFAAAAVVQNYYADYFRVNIFGSSIRHRYACLANTTTKVSSNTWQGFSNSQFCVAGTPYNISAGTFIDSYFFGPSSSGALGRLNSCEQFANNRYGLTYHATRSRTCNYNPFNNCNSDCWIRYFSTCVGRTTVFDVFSSPCFGYSYP
jgi:hypothetical protein